MKGIQEWLSFYYKSPMAARAAARARSFHPADQAQEHAASFDGRRSDHPPRPGVTLMRDDSARFSDSRLGRELRLESKSTRVPALVR
jgi:hypothetical protein